VSKDYTEDPRMGVHAAAVQLDANLHVDAVAQHIHNFDTKAEHERNNGIFQDGGITELYETAYSTADAGLFPSDSLFPDDALYPVDLVVNIPGGVHYATNGKRIRLATSLISTPSVLLTDLDEIERFVATISGIFFDRHLVTKRYIDVIISSDGIHGLGIWADYSAIYLDEFLLSDQTITQSSTLVGSLAGYSYGLANAAIVRGNAVDYTSVVSTSGIVYCTLTAAKLAIAGTSYTISALTLTSRAQADNLTAYYCGGSVLASIPTAVPGIFTDVSPWTSWTRVQFTATDGISMISQTNMDSAGTTLALAASTASQTIPNFLITVDAGGAVATASAAGTLYPSFANFKMESGVVSPLGSAGIYSTTGAAPYGQFNLSASLANNPNTTKPLVAPDLDFNSFTVTLGTANAVMSLKSYKNTISIITAKQSNMLADGGAMINDFGGGDFDSDLQSGNVFASTNTSGVLYPPDYRKKEAGQDYGWFTYKLNSGKFVIVSLIESANPQYTEIAHGVVSFNCLGSSNTIIDTNKAIPYENVSGYVNSFFTNYTNTSSLAYVKKFNKYSNAIDQGLLTIDTTPFTVPTTGDGAKVNDYSLYNGSSGAYIGNLIVPPGLTVATTYYNISNSGTYVFNANVPISGSSTFESGFAQLISATAVQTPGYYGYLLANLLSKRYDSTFNLYGQKYVFDGERIYSVTLSQGDAGTVNGVPQTQAFANGLRFIAASPTVAYFVSDFDNSVSQFNGGRTVTRVQGFSQKGKIQDGCYSVRDDALYLRCATFEGNPPSIVTIRYGIITENPSPTTDIGLANINNTDVGVYYVSKALGSASALIRSYYSLGAMSAIIPLDFQTAFFGMRDNQRMSVSKIVGYLLYADKAPSAWTLNWNWQTQDQQGTTVATVAPACNTDGYARFEWNPSPASVTAGQFRMTTTDAVQKKVLLELIIYYKPESDANLPVTNKAS
jgi:hypothetical protein